MLPPRLVAAIAVTLVALIVVAVAVGLYRNNLDPLGVVTVLSTLFSGVVVGVNFKGRNGRNGGDHS
jgi:hypothetical protein